MTNDEKAEMIAVRNGNQRFCKNCDDCCKPYNSTDDCFKSAMQMAEWKDEQLKEQRRIIRNHWQEWAENQIKKTLVDFMLYLENRGFFQDDLCFDIEHQVETFIELRNKK